MRIEQLTFTRFVAAMAIVFFHFGKPLNIFSQEHIHKLLAQANIGVSYFFILSGFVMVIAYGRKSKVHPVSYMKNRFARIYPVYFLALLLCLFHMMVLNNSTVPISDILLNIFALQSWVPAKTMSINFPGWSLSVEFFFYLTFPFLCNYFFKKFKLKTVAVAIIIFWIFSQIFFHYAVENSQIHRNFSFYFPLLHLNQFLVGNLAGLYFINYLKDRQKNYDVWIVLLSVVLILLLLFSPSFLQYHNGLLALIFVPFILLNAMNTGWLTKIQNKKFLVYLGEISYGIYILQIPVHWFTETMMNLLNIEGDLKIFIAAVALLLVVSALSYTFIETPLREKIKKTRLNVSQK